MNTPTPNRGAQNRGGPRAARRRRAAARGMASGASRILNESRREFWMTMEGSSKANINFPFAILPGWSRAFAQYEQYAWNGPVIVEWVPRCSANVTGALALSVETSPEGIADTYGYDTMLRRDPVRSGPVRNALRFAFDPRTLQGQKGFVPHDVDLRNTFSLLASTSGDGLGELYITWSARFSVLRAQSINAILSAASVSFAADGNGPWEVKAASSTQRGTPETHASVTKMGVDGDNRPYMEFNLLSKNNASVDVSVGDSVAGKIIDKTTGTVTNYISSAAKGIWKIFSPKDKAATYVYYPSTDWIVNNKELAFSSLSVVMPLTYGELQAASMSLGTYSREKGWVGELSDWAKHPVIVDYPAPRRSSTSSVKPTPRASIVETKPQYA